MKIKFVIAMASVFLTAACSNNKPETLGSLTYVQESDEDIVIDPLNHQQVRDEYTELLGLVEDEHLKEQIERRVADVYMMEGAHEQTTAEPTKTQYLEAIKAYRNVLERYPNSPDNAEVLYQLAKAYDMIDDPDAAIAVLDQLTTRYPNYVNVAEAYFRMGDIFFNRQEYALAQAAYHAVTQKENERLATNSRYMLGWSYYKQAQFGNSLKEFAVVLDGLLAKVEDLDDLGKAERPMAADTIHSISLALDKVGGATAIATMPMVANQSYVWMLYEDLGDYYLEKERYENAASTYRAFVTAHSDSGKAPVLHNKIITTYIDGGFPSLALEEKEKYVEAYGIYSKYAGNRGGINPHVAASLKVYIDELARHYYNQGRAIDTESDDTSSPDGHQVFDHEKTAEEETAQVKPRAVAAYEKAAGFYAQFAETFPQDKRIDEVRFLMSESLFLAQRYADAIPGYESVAYQPLGTSATKYANNAGYAAIIAYQKHIATLPPESRKVKTWQAQAVESMLLFAKTFHADKRAVAVLTNAAEYLFGLDEYERALTVSSALIANNQALDRGLKKTAYGIIAHSYFNLSDYHNAELNYIHQLNLVDKNTKEHQQVSERLATALYRKSEELEAQGESEAAVEQLLKIKKLTPNSVLRVAAQYDAATMLISMEQWDAAITELNQLIASYPDHELAVEFPRRLAFSYEKNENWRMAAVSYQKLAKTDPDSEVRQEALFIAATMYEKDGNYQEAVSHFRDYANTYDAPIHILMEARYKLAINYQRTGDTDKRLFWLDKIVQGEKHYESNDRTRWLAAWANTEYGDHYAQNFARHKLFLPLTKSVPAKNEMLEKASARYQMAADLGILEFATRASFKIAHLYHQFAEELRRSPRPEALSAEERVIYDDILEEQAKPFDQISIDLHQANIDRAWAGEFDQWIDKSFAAMRALKPARFNKSEIIVSYGDELR